MSFRRVGLWLSACLLGACALPVWAAGMPSEKPFEVVPGSFGIASSTLQAGAHGDLTTTFDFAHDGTGKTFNDVRTTVVNLPSGYIGNNTALPTCPDSQLVALVVTEGSNCPPDSQVGTITLTLTLVSKPVRVKFPVYNMEVTSPGMVAALGFNAVLVTQILPVTVRPGDSGLTVTSPDILGITEPHEISVTVWGVPAAKVHDGERGEQCLPEPLDSTKVECKGGGKQVNIPIRPFLSNPTSCEAKAANMKADSWETSEDWSEVSAEVMPVDECERVPFTPSVVAQPTTDSAESSSGLNLSLVVPQTWDKPESVATSHLKDSVIALPVGYTINPSSGSGLGACTPSQLEAETATSSPGAGCPQEAKIGSVEVETPVLSQKLTGSIYVAKPFDNPFGSLLALYIVIKNPQLGVIVKLAGHVELDPVTGQVVTRFENNPQVPFSRFAIKLRQGATSPLVSPPVCGAYMAQADLTPWSEPTQPRHLTSVFQIEKGIGGGPCPAGGVPPFAPTVLAGTQSNAGGSYSPFYLRIARNDGEQEITKFSTTLPPGLTANLTGVPFCPDTQVEAARHASGQQELNEPSCPPASEIGHTLVGAGVGSVLAWTPGKVYLAGPYHGAPFSIVSITSATVGPFDLGTVVIRFALRINPVTAQAEIDSTGSDPIPHIIDGIVVHVRDIHTYIDRANFMINPTSCAHMSIADTVTGAGADYTNPADQMPVAVSTPFQAADCQSLEFKPSFKVSTSGRTSRARGASLNVRLAYPNLPQGSQANIRSVKVELPKQLPSRLTTLQKACPYTTFSANPASCPEASRVGVARATTPILPVPLTGPAYFVSNGGAKFPELVIVLQGYGVTVDLHGETFISKKGITSSTFRTTPDVPVGTFELTLPQGTNSALAANGDLCRVTRIARVRRKVTITSGGRTRHVTRTAKRRVPATMKMPTTLIAQNGRVIHTLTSIATTGCPKTKKKSGGRR